MFYRVVHPALMTMIQQSTFWTKPFPCSFFVWGRATGIGASFPSTSDPSPPLLLFLNLRKFLRLHLHFFPTVLGCTGLLWTVIRYTGLYWSVLGSSELNWALMDCTGLHSAAHCCTGLHWAVLGSTGLYWTVLGCTGLCLAANVRYGSQKLYGLFGLNHHMLEKMCDVLPVTEHR